MGFRYKLAQFFNGRYITYGIDFLSKVIAIVCIIISVINILLHSYILSSLQLGLFVLLFFRLFSRNILKRQAENRKALNILSKVKGNFAFNKRKRADRDTHIYKKCPHCSVILRLPKTKGEHTVKCPQCKNNFKVKVR